MDEQLRANERAAAKGKQMCSKHIKIIFPRKANVAPEHEGDEQG